MQYISNKDDGFCLISGDENKKRRLCDHVRVTAYCTHEGSHDKSAEIEFWDCVNKKVLRVQVSFSTLHKQAELMTELSSKGFVPPSNRTDRALVAQHLSKSQPALRKHLVRKIGWHDLVFVLPTITLGNDPSADTATVYDRTTKTPLVDYTTGGTLDEWKAGIAAPGASSTRIITGISGALAATALAPAGESNFAVQFFGPSSSGKSTLLHIIRSVGGFAGEGSLFTWDNTNKGFEEIAAASNCCALITDETQLVDERDSTIPVTARRRAYQFVQGRSKTRSERYRDEQEPPSTWTGILFSAGEDSFTALASRSGNARTGGEVHRFIDVPAIADPGRGDLGIFDKVPSGFRSSAQAADAIRAACGKFYGKPLRRFISKWIEDPAEALRLFKQKKEWFLREALPEKLGGIEKRFCERFAIIYAAGSLARDWKILPWSRKRIREAVLSCYLAARQTLDVTHPRPTVLLAKLSQKIKSLRDTKLLSADTVLIQKATSKHPARVLVGGKQLYGWFPVISQRDALLDYLEARDFILRPPSRKPRTIQARIDGERRDYYALDLRVLKPPTP